MPAGSAPTRPYSDDQSDPPKARGSTPSSPRNGGLAAPADPRARRLLALHEVALAIGAQRDTGGALDLILEQACRLIGVPAGAIFLWDEATGTLRRRLSLNLPTDEPLEPSEPEDGASGQAFRTGVAVIVDDHGGRPDARSTRRSRPAPAELSVPLRAGERLLGALTMYMYADEPLRSFAEEDAWLLGLLGDQAALALEQARLVEEAEARADRLLAIHRLSTAAAGRAEPRAIFRLIARAAVDLLAQTASAVYLWDEADGVLRLAAHAGLGDEPPHAKLKPGEHLAGQVWLSGAPFVEDSSSARRASSGGIGAGDASAAGFPLLTRGRLLGALCVQGGGSAPRFTSEDLRILEVLANQAAAAVGSARLFEQATRAQALEELAHLKGEFVSAVSHELRTPLSFVYGYAELLALREHSPTQARAMAEQIYEAAERMRRLVDDLLDLGRMGAQGFRLRRRCVEISELLRRAVGEVQARAPERTFRLTIGHVPPVLADADRIGQVLDNLLENAVRYAPDGPITLRARAVADMVRVEVADRGPGIAPHESDRVFEPFYRGERSEISPVRGGGLGLSIARQLVERHGGSIGLTSRPGRGSTFWFTIPTVDSTCPDPSGSSGGP